MSIFREKILILLFLCRYTFNKKKNTGEYDKLINLYKKWADWYLSSHGSAANGRQYWQMLLQDNPEGPHIVSRFLLLAAEELRQSQRIGKFFFFGKNCSEWLSN